MSWEQLYDLLGIRDFIYFISSPTIQDQLFGIKLIFIFFAVFFLCAVVYFYINSSYLQYQFLQDATEFFSWQAYGLRAFSRRWKKITKRTESNLENDLKLSIIDADDFLRQTLEYAGYTGDTFEELVENAGKKITPSPDEAIFAHSIRNSIVYQPDYKLSPEDAQKALAIYEEAIKSVTLA